MNMMIDINTARIVKNDFLFLFSNESKAIMTM